MKYNEERESRLKTMKKRLEGVSGGAMYDIWKIHYDLDYWNKVNINGYFVYVLKLESIIELEHKLCILSMG